MMVASVDRLRDDTFDVSTSCQRVPIALLLSRRTAPQRLLC